MQLEIESMSTYRSVAPREEQNFGFVPGKQQSRGRRGSTARRLQKLDGAAAKLLETEAGLAGVAPLDLAPASPAKDGEDGRRREWRCGLCLQADSVWGRKQCGCGGRGVQIEAEVEGWWAGWRERTVAAREVDFFAIGTHPRGGKMAPNAFVFGRAVNLGKEMGYCWSQVFSFILEMGIFWDVFKELLEIA